ncbi:MAG: nucleotidyltransferase family protein [Cyanobacteria bacterium P01_A01_bin.83]
MIASLQLPTKISHSQPVESLEIELLLNCVRTIVDQDHIVKIRALIQPELDWNYLLSTAVAHGVIPLLAYNLTNICSEAIPRHILLQLQNYLQSNALNNLGLTHQLMNILQFLELNKIPAIPFKGIVLATSVYRNPLLRKISDLDILVHSQDMPRAKDLLMAQGYKIRNEVPWECHLIKDNGINIDLHAEIAPQHISCPLQSDELWQHLEPLSLGETTVSNLSPEMLLFVLCLNGSKECWRSLSRICDVAELINSDRQIDWQLIMQQAEQWGFKRVICLGCLLAQNFLGVTLPNLIWQQIQSDLTTQSLALEVRKNLFVSGTEPIGEVERTIFCIRTRERWQDKVQSSWGIVTFSGGMKPSQNDRDFLILPKFLYFIHYIIRPFRIIGKYCFRNKLG